MTLRATPFHARVATANRGNAWRTRGGFTLADAYGDPEAEALGVRAGAAMADVSWRSRLLLEGARAGDCASRLFTRDAAQLLPGESMETAWLNDEGALRGMGIVARLTTYSYLVVATQGDFDWIARAARLFDVSCRDIATAQCGLALVGPGAASVLAAAGIGAHIAPLAIAPRNWHGRQLLLSRWGHGYEIWCAPRDALMLWDGLVQAGGAHALAPIGLSAMDVLDLESGIPISGRDFASARDQDAKGPLPRMLGLAPLIDEKHVQFNGRSAYIRGPYEQRSLMGLEIESQWPAPYTPIEAGGRTIGHTLYSAYSPALRRAIALALIDEGEALPARSVSLTMPPARGRGAFSRVDAMLVRLPFLPIAAPIFVEA
ncbi:MAG TPA: glycine cleavage T C-terminal barrel domain-containing protein [Rhizomicrobium sp.]|nr:glycine cleavage T C-terminal barrel domain-containing protein [Rhizomicrobium sp.]